MLSKVDCDFRSSLEFEIVIESIVGIIDTQPKVVPVIAKGLGSRRSLRDLDHMTVATNRDDD